MADITEEQFFKLAEAEVAAMRKLQTSLAAAIATLVAPLAPALDAVKYLNGKIRQIAAMLPSGVAAQLKQIQKLLVGPIQQIAKVQKFFFETLKTLIKYIRKKQLKLLQRVWAQLVATLRNTAILIRTLITNLQKGLALIKAVAGKLKAVIKAVSMVLRDFAAKVAMLVAASGLVNLCKKILNILSKILVLTANLQSRLHKTMMQLIRKLA